MKHYDVLVIGGGMAAASLVLQLATQDQPPKTCVVNQESHFGYNRVLLPELLAGDCDQPSLFKKISNHSSFDWLTVLNNEACLRIDKSQRVATTQFQTIGYQAIVFATGAAPLVPAVAGIDSPGVRTLRSIDDTHKLSRIASDLNHCVVLGGGLLGLETADAMNRCGANVTVVHRGPYLMNKQVDARCGHLLKQIIESNGIATRCNSAITNIMTDSNKNRIDRVSINGETVATDCLLLACGTQPRINLAIESGFRCAGGIVVDSQLQAEPHAYALGECAEINGQRFSYVDAVFDQANVLARSLVGKPQEFVPTTPATRLKVANVALFAAGDASIAPDNQVTLESSCGKLRRNLCFKQTRLVSATLLGDLTGSNQVRAAMGQAIPSRTAREKLAFGF